MTITDFKRYASQFLQKIQIQGLFQGNLTADTAKAIMDKVLTQLKPQPIDNVRISYRTMRDEILTTFSTEILQPSAMTLQAHQLPVGAHYFRCASMNPNDVNSVVCNFYQIGPTSVKTLSLIELLMMIAEEPLFNTLRSKETLGYDVSCGLRDNFGILGYSIMVNSQEHKFAAEYVEERIEAFRSELLNIVRQIKDNEFQQYKESLAKIKLNDDNSMKDEVTRHWLEIITNEYAFDRGVRDVECLLTITKSDFIEFFERHFHHTKKLSIQVSFCGLGNKYFDFHVHSLLQGHW